MKRHYLNYRYLENKRLQECSVLMLWFLCLLLSYVKVNTNYTDTNFSTAFPVHLLQHSEWLHYHFPHHTELCITESNHFLMRLLFFFFYLAILPSVAEKKNNLKMLLENKLRYLLIHFIKIIILEMSVLIPISIIWLTDTSNSLLNE